MKLSVKNLFLFIWLIFLQILFAQDFPARPENYVNDYAGILNPQQENQLNRMLQTYEDSTSNQFVVAIFQNAQDYPVEEFAIRLAEKWKVGQQDRENGIIMAIFLDERKVRIEVGYGLEDVIPDATAFKIIRDYITPQFRNGNYYDGIREGLAGLMASAAGKFEGFEKQHRRDSNGFNPLALVIFLIIFLIFAARRRRGFVADSGGWHRGGGPVFWGGFGGRGGGSGGGFSGGFSAGGGSFGGGGATGSW